MNARAQHSCPLPCWTLSTPHPDSPGTAGQPPLSLCTTGAESTHELPTELPTAMPLSVAWTPGYRADSGWALHLLVHAPGEPSAQKRRGKKRGSTWPRSRVTLTSLYSRPRDSGGLCHQRSVPSMALLTGCALLLFAAVQMSQYWPCGDTAVRGPRRAGTPPRSSHPSTPNLRTLVHHSLIFLAN